MLIPAQVNPPTHPPTQVELIPTIKSYVQAAITLLSKQDYDQAINYLEPAVEVLACILNNDMCTVTVS